MAAWQAHLIEQNKPILHGVWALLSGFLIALATWWMFPRLVAEGPLWRMLALYVSAQGCSRLVIFNVLLNWFRGLRWNYTSPMSGSLMDHLELRLFRQRVWLMEVFVAVIFLTLQLFL